nr:hypothetical protein [Tanacetum cinerariifolium]
MTGNRAMLTNFVEKFLGTVRFGNNDFTMIAGYGDVVIGSMTIKKVYYVEGLGHNIFSVGQFCDKGLEVAFRKSTCFVRTEDGVDLLTGVRWSNLYTIAHNKVESNSSTCLLAKDSSSKIFNPLVSQVSETSKKDLEDLFQNFYDEYFDSSNIMKSSATNVETSNVEIPSNEEEVFHESSESFQEESSSFSLIDDVNQCLEEVAVPSLNTQSDSNNMVPNVDEASTSHNVFNKRLKNAYFDASTSFHDPSNVHTFYQPYPHEKKWTKDHLLHKIISNPKSSVHTRGQLANTCFFSCLLSSIEPVNVAEALRDADWVSAMQEELVPRTEGKTIIKTKWIFKNKKDESNLVIRNKARLVAVGYSQQKGIDYDETFAPVAQIEATRLFLAFTAHKDFTVFQIDVKTSFLNGIIKEEVYVGQTAGFVSKQYPHHVYALDKTFYGLKQAPRAWPDIMFATCMCARYQANPNEHHVSAVKRIFRYLKRTINLGLWHLKDSGFDLTAYSDADHAKCHLDRKTESEYVTVSSCRAQVLWMRTQLKDYGLFYDKVPIYCDSKSAIAISCNLGSVFTMIENFQGSDFSSLYDVGEDDEKQKREIC